KATRHVPRTFDYAASIYLPTAADLRSAPHGRYKPPAAARSSTRTCNIRRILRSLGNVHTIIFRAKLTVFFREIRNRWSFYQCSDVKRRCCSYETERLNNDSLRTANGAASGHSPPPPPPSSSFVSSFDTLARDLAARNKGMKIIAISQCVFILSLLETRTLLMAHTMSMTEEDDWDTLASENEIRSFDGTGNNQEHNEWGSVGQRQLRKFAPSNYTDGVSTPP
ncbi:unnamed protein product, partial [Ascophyllum nodosum]